MTGEEGKLMATRGNKFITGARASKENALHSFIKDEIKKRRDTGKLKKERARELLQYAPRPTLSEKQEWAIKQFSKNRKKLIGESVKLISDSAGRIAPDNPGRYQGNITGFGRAKGGMPRLKIHWADNKTYSVWLYQMDFLREYPHLSDKERERLVLGKLLKNLTDRINTQRANLKAELASVKSYRLDSIAKTKACNRKIKGLDEKLKRYKKEVFDKERLEEEFKLIKKLDTVENVYISEKENIIVLTKTLYAVDREKINKKVNLGRYVILLDCRNSDVLINNRDWIYHDTYGHPFLSGESTCWGDGRANLNEMFREGRIFQLVDFILTFYTLFPHGRGASPHVDYDIWLEGRVKTSNDTLIERKL